MGDTTTLDRIAPKSETHFRQIQARGHRRRGIAGDEAAARTHEHAISDIREGRREGDSRKLRLCPPCFRRGEHYLLIEVDGKLCCGTCGEKE